MVITFLIIRKNSFL